MARTGRLAAIEVAPEVHSFKEQVPDEFKNVALANAGIGLWQLYLSSERLDCDLTSSRLLGQEIGTFPHTRHDLLDIVHAEDRQGVSLRMELCSKVGAPLSCSFRLANLHKSEEVRWLEMTASRIQSADDDFALVGTLRDVTEKMWVEKVLRENEARLSVIFSQTLVGVMHNDRDRNILMVNDRFLELVGRTREELSGLSFEAYTHPEDLAWNVPLFREKTARGEPFTVEKRYVRPNGSIVWCEVNVSYVIGPDGEWTSNIVFAHDITDRKLAQEERQRSQEMLELALDGAGAGTWELDYANGGKLRLSANAVAIYGLPGDHCGLLTHEEWASLLDPNSLEQVTEEFPAFLESDVPHSAEFKIRLSEGKERWLRAHGRTSFDEQGNPAKIVGLVYDDSERKLAEEELRESEERLRFTQESGQIGTFFVDLEGVVHGSRQYFRNLGLPDDTDTIDNETWRSLFHPDDLKRIDREVAQAEDSRAPFYESEHRIFRADNGELRWILVRVAPERAANGDLVRVVGAHIDVTEAKNAARMLQASQSFNEQIVESSTDCIKILDPDGSLKFMSKKGLEALEIENPEFVIGRLWQELWPKAFRRAASSALESARAGKVGRFNGLCPTAKGTSKWWDVVVTPLKDEAGAVSRLLCVSRDVTEIREHSEKVRWAAEHDGLTGLPNRNCFDTRLAAVLDQAEATGEQVGLLALDVDNFKQVNDAFGHAAGDTLLKTLSERVKGLIEEGDFAARLGGDEFAIVLRNLENGRDLLNIGNRINEKMKEPIVHQGYILDCRASLGAASFPEHGDNGDELLKCADTALYVAKAAGRSNVVLFEPAFQSELDRRKTTIDTARSALRRNDIEPFYQPKVSLHTGKIVGFEALLRWRDPSGKVRLPSEIEAVFEDLELAHEISERMQDRVMQDVQSWLDARLDFGHVAINAAAAEFSRNDFSDRLLDRLYGAAIPPTCLQVEVTETVFVGRGADHVDYALNRLKQSGVQIALDDFGTGYASLSHLKRFPVDIIKIDRSFIAELGTNTGDTAIVTALLGLSAEMGLKVVAEGIETEAQAAFLRERRCDYGQGYLYGKALSALEIKPLIARQGPLAETTGRL